MYAREWAEKNNKTIDLDFKSEIIPCVDLISPIVWAEHCVECAFPLCYGKCEKFRRRIDGRCKLFDNGIVKIPNNNSLLNYCVEITFGEWAKLEADVCFGLFKQNKIRNLDNSLHFLAKSTRLFSKTFESKDKMWIITNKNYNLRDRIIRSKNQKIKPDFFVAGIYNFNDKFSFILEVKKKDNTVIYRNNIEVKKGYNETLIPFKDFKLNLDEEYKIYIYTNDGIKTVYFTILDFITFNNEYKNNNKQKKKLKCIAWDLDNTLWDGVLIENDVKLKDGIKDIIKEIDQKGIINSIISKNNHDDAMKKIKELQLDEYFVMPQINWDPKSINMKRLADDMNIGIDTIAFIDDSPFEKSEVAEAYPEVTIYDASEYVKLLSYKEFDVIVTEDTKKRRSTYKMLEKQKDEMKKWDGDIDDFLRNCKMVATFRKPNKDEILRCYELIQRTNQLNSSGRRLNLEEVEEIVNNETDYETYIINVEDKFGKYGIVGFSIVDIKDTPTITDFVISCRVANKKVEHTYITYLANKYKKRNHQLLKMNYVKTAKNGPIFKVVEDMKMNKEEPDDNYEIYSINLKNDIAKIDIMEIKEK